MKSLEVFTPAGVPTVTYIERDGQRLEKALHNSIITPGIVTSLSGPSKSGKTTLIHRVIKPDLLISVSGAAIRSSESLWDRVLNWMDAPSETTRKGAHTTGTEVSVKASGKVGIPVVAEGAAEGSGTAKYSYENSNERKFIRSGIDQVIKEIGESEFVVFIDDFHYMNRDVQQDVAKNIKEAAEKGVSICTASVPHRADDVVRGNTELRGRVKAIDFAYWDQKEIEAIGTRGFAALNMAVDHSLIARLASEAFGSPQLMQQMCLQTCFYFDVYDRPFLTKKINHNNNDIDQILEATSTTTDFSSLLEALHSGPRQRGTARSKFKFTDGTEGDVYRCILVALKQDPPQLSFTYDDIYQRTRKVCDGDAPPGSSVAQALEQLQTISESIQPTAPVVEWSEDVLDVVDPYFLFYLRGSTRLTALAK